MEAHLRDRRIDASPDSGLASFGDSLNEFIPLLAIVACFEPPCDFATHQLPFSLLESFGQRLFVGVNVVPVLRFRTDIKEIDPSRFRSSMH